MRKAIIISLLAVCLAAPVKASAFGFGDILTFGRKIFKAAEPRPAPPQVDEKKIDRAVPVDMRNQWKEKYRVWKQAYDLGEIAPLFQNKNNFIFSEEELNYFAQKAYDTATTTPVRDIKIDLKKGSIAVSGYSLFNMLKGDFSAEFKVLNGNDGVYIKVIRAKLGKMWVPAMLLDNIVKGETKKLKKFLYSNESRQNLKVVIEEDVLRLEYEQ
jgi:hypothetical protein